VSQSGNARQRQAVETRLHLLAAACEVFKERGYQATSVGAITTRANTAHGTFYLYFKNKEDAFCEVMDAVYDELMAASGSRVQTLEPKASSREVLEQIIRGFFDAYVPHHGMWRAVVEGAFASERVHAMWLDRRRVMIDQVRILLQEGQARGTVRPLDLVRSANALASMVEWFAFTQIELPEQPMTDDDLDAVVTVLADLWHHAVSGRVPD
jgi:AcrR family transcriptional regulator